MPAMPSASVWPARLENPEASGRMIFVCEHASNAFPMPFGSLGLSPTQQSAHIAWDPGAIGLARGLARLLDGVVIAGQVSRLVYDCNRPPDSPGAMVARSELHDIPGNAGLTDAARLARVRAVYEPFHASLRADILRRMTLDQRPVIVTVHSFTPVYNHQHRTVQFGVIHDADPGLALAVMQAAAQLPLTARLNEPYSAADHVTHTLRLHATPYGLPNVMLEVRSDLIATPEGEQSMAAMLAPVLAEALAAYEQHSGADAPRITKTG